MEIALDAIVCVGNLIRMSLLEDGVLGSFRRGGWRVAVGVMNKKRKAG